LHHVFRAPKIAEHTVCVRHKQRPMRLKDGEIGGR
jgi:hypothetical protein